MGFQIGSTTVIDNNKYLTNIGGNGGIISGSVSVPANNTWRYVRLNGCWPGNVYALGTFNNDDSGMTGFTPSYSFVLFSSIGYSGSKQFASVDTIVSHNNTTSTSYTSGSNYVAIMVKNNYSGSRSFYYTFYYTGPNTPTVSFT